MDTLDSDTFFTLSDFLTDSELVLFYCTCRQYRDMLPRKTSCLRVLETPINFRDNVAKYIQAADILAGCTCGFELTFHVDAFNGINCRSKAVDAMEVASNCIDRILNTFLCPDGRFLTAGEVKSFLTFGIRGVFGRKPRFYRIRTYDIHMTMTMDMKMKVTQGPMLPSIQIHRRSSSSRDTSGAKLFW
jgi:hypothetical protein